jgi:antibiotic biosynthesis monooxygenase (ABM) superfamily enzyme
MSWIKKAILWPCLATILLAVAALATPASAQDANIRSVTFYTVKPDRIGDFQAEIKEYNAILAKAGSDRYSTIWVSLTGPYEYLRVQMYSKWADLDNTIDKDPKLKDQAVDLARLSTHIIECTSSWHRDIEVINPDLSLPDPGVDLPKMIRVLVTQVRPDKYHDYLDLQKNVILPAVTKGAPKFYNFAEKRFGGPGPEFISVTGFNNWADLDDTIGAEKGLGKDGYQALTNQVRALIVQSEYVIYRYEPDLGYLPAPATPPATK